MRRTRLVAAVALGLLLVHTWRPAKSAAQASAAAASMDVAGSDVPEAYGRATQLGHGEYELHNYAEARARFLEAHQIYPNARSLRALGAVEYDLKSYTKSIDYLERALASDVRPLEGELRVQTEELLRLARGYAATFTIQVGPVAASIELDHELVQPRADGTLLIAVGDHDLAVHAPGYISVRKALRVASGEDANLSIQLSPVPKPVQREEPLRRKWWVWTAAGVLAAGAVAGLVVGLRAREQTGEPSASNLEGVPSVHALMKADR